MDGDAVVSIIVPVYNVEKYVKECVDSIINQTYKNIEIILVDDGSTDSSGKICDDFAKIDERVKTIHKKNGGLSDARNEGVKYARGKYVSFIDGDDYISPYFIEILIKVKEENSCDFVLVYDCPSFWDGEDNTVLAKNADDFTAEIVDAKTGLQRMFLQNIATGAPFKLCPKEYFEDIHFPKGYLYEDAATTYKYFFKAKKVGIVYSELYAYRMRKDSIIRQQFNEKKLIVEVIYQQLINDKMVQKWDLTKDAYSRAFSLVFTVFLQIPEDDKVNMQKLWKYIKQSRKYVICNSSRYCRRKNKIAAMISFSGMKITYFIGRKIGQKGSMK